MRRDKDLDQNVLKLNPANAKRRKNKKLIILKTNKKKYAEALATTLFNIVHRMRLEQGVGGLQKKR